MVYDVVTTPDPVTYDVVIALGKNWRAYPPKHSIPGDFKLHLSLESKMTALAAARLLRDGTTDRIIISTGKTAGNDWLSESEEMCNYIKIRNEDLLGRISLEEISIDTAGNAEECKKIIDSAGYQDIAILTTRAHLLRASLLFNNYGIEADGFTSEDVLQECGGKTGGMNYRGFLGKYKFSKRSVIEQIKEKAILYPFTWTFDSKGKLLRYATNIIRHQT